MAHHKDAIKRMKQNANRRARNRHYRSRMRNQIKRLRQAVEEGDQAIATEQLRLATSIIHGNVSRGVIHRNQAARKISRLNAAVKQMGNA